MSTSQQLVLDFPHRPALGATDFIVSASNAAAVAAVDAWPDWPARALVFVGPKGSGKTHLGNVWRLKSGAVACAAEDIDEGIVEAASRSGSVLVEDIDRGVRSERLVFHLLNLAREEQVSVLLTARTAPGLWVTEIADLRSRYRSLATATIGMPDTGLLSAVLVKLLHDRQLPATPAAIQHLTRHMDRSMEFAVELVEELDQMVWEVSREVNRSVAKIVLERLQQRRQFGEP